MPKDLRNDGALNRNLWRQKIEIPLPGNNAGNGERRW